MWHCTSMRGPTRNREAMGAPEGPRPWCEPLVMVHEGLSPPNWQGLQYGTPTNPDPTLQLVHLVLPVEEPSQILHYKIA